MEIWRAKFSLYSINHDTLTTNEGGEAQLHTFLTLASEGCSSQLHALAASPLLKTLAPNGRKAERYQSHLAANAKRNIFDWTTILQLASPQPSHCTDWAIAAAIKLNLNFLNFILEFTYIYRGYKITLNISRSFRNIQTLSLLNTFSIITNSLIWQFIY